MERCSIGNFVSIPMPPPCHRGAGRRRDADNSRAAAVAAAGVARFGVPFLLLLILRWRRGNDSSCSCPLGKTAADTDRTRGA
eukprot:gene7849-biopygen21086